MTEAVLHVTELLCLSFFDVHKAALYLDYVSGKYIIAFAGTETDVLADIRTDLYTGATGLPGDHFLAAISKQKRTGTAMDGRVEFGGMCGSI